MSNAGAIRWAPIAGWEGYYEASNQGGVRSVERIIPNGHGATRRAPGRILTARIDRVGYFEVELNRQGRPAKRRVHHLVLEAFVGPRPQGFVGCHNDGDKLNNELSNLRWDTYAENNRDTVRHGTHRNASKSHCRQGHEFTAENTYWVLKGPRSPGRRRLCRACNLASTTKRCRSKSQHGRCTLPGRHAGPHARHPLAVAS